MSQHVDSNVISRPADAVTGAYLRAFINSDGEVAIAGANDPTHGVTLKDALAIGDDLPIKTLNASGTFEVTVAAATTIGQVLYGAASGKATPTANGQVPFAVALTAGSGDGAVVEAAPLNLGSRIFATTHTVTAGEASANSGNGRADIDTGFGTVNFSFVYFVRNTSDNVTNAGYVTSKLTSTDAGKIRIDGVAAGVQLDENDQIEIVALRN